MREEANSYLFLCNYRGGVTFIYYYIRIRGGGKPNYYIFITVGRGGKNIATLYYIIEWYLTNTQI